MGNLCCAGDLYLYLVGKLTLFCARDDSALSSRETDTLLRTG